MSARLTKRVGTPLLRWGIGLTLVAGVLLLSGCSAEATEEWKRLAMPEPGTKEAGQIFYFWRWSWVALLLVGVFVWA